MTYIFLDEIQNVPQFQKAVDSLFIKDNVDVYITGSNAQMLSGELATLLSGRYIEVSMLPLSFGEYYEMVGGDKRDAWNSYFRNGGFPYTAAIEDEEIRRDYLMGIYNTVLLKDVVARKRISDIPLLESVIKFLFDNIGNIVSSKKIADSLTSYGRKTTSVTVENYIEALTGAFVLYKAGRYDVKGKQHLKSLEKYYLVDVGLQRNRFYRNDRR
jgi:predicted AAA+ superfamily ATPase